MAQDDTAAIIETFKMALAHPGIVFGSMLLVCKLTTLVSLACLAIAVVMGGIRRMNGAPRSGGLAVIGVIGLVFGLLGAAYGGLNTYITAQLTHVTRLVIYLPSLIESGLCVLVGVLAWLVARLGNAGARRA